MPKEQENYHVFLMVLPYGLVRPLLPRLRGLSKVGLKVFSQLPEDLKKTDMAYSPEDYLSAGMLSYVFLGGFFGFFIWWLSLQQGRDAHQAVTFGLGAAAALILLFLILLVRMPSIQAKSRAEEEDKYLLYALKDLSLQMGSGSSLFYSLKSVSQSNYGPVSVEFDRVVRRVAVGVPMAKALREMAERTRSEYLTKTAWQMINSLRAGADLRLTLQSIIDDLNNEQKTKIMQYARELNLWSLVYMLFAVAIPTIGSTMMVILSTFAGFGITQATFISFVVICFIVQFILMNFVKVRRPVVQF